MTIINPKSIAGVTSITTPSGSDNLFTVHTNNTTERVRINNDGDVIVGSGITVSPDGDIFATGVTTSTSFTGTLNTAAQPNVTSLGTLTSLDISGGLGIAESLFHLDDTNTRIAFPANDTITADTGGTERLRIDSTGRLFLNTTTEGNAGADDFTIGQISGSTGITIRSGTTNNGNLYFSDGTSGDDEYRGSIQYQHANNSLHVATNAVERLIIDSSGRFLLGLTSSRGNYGNNTSGVDYKMQIEGTGATSSSLALIRNSNDANDGGIILGKTRSTSVGGNTVVQAGDDIGTLSFVGADGTSLQFGADIGAEVESGVGNDDMPTALYFKTNAGSTSTSERMRIESGGNVVIGTTSASSKLHVHSANHYVLTSSGVAHRHIHCSAVNGNAGEYGGAISFSMGSTGAAAVAGLQGASDADNVGLSFITHNSGTGSDNAQESARLTSDGKFLVGRTSSITITGDGSTHVFEAITDNGYALATHSNTTNKRGIGIYYPSSSGASDAIRFVISSSAKFIVNGDGNVTNANNSYGSISDVSLKENIVDANSQWDDIKNIRVRNYNFKESTGQQTHTQIGVVAQELETVSPNLVEVSDKDGMKNVQYSVLYMKSVKALQEAMTRIEILETRLNNAGIAT